MQLTPNYNLKKPEGTDPVDIQDFNDNADILDAELNKKADSAGGDISNMTIKALEEPAGTQFPIPEAGETSKSFLGKIRKFMNDFKSWNTGVCMIGQIVNNCVTNNDKLPLSAAQGKVLMDLYSVLNTNFEVTPGLIRIMNIGIRFGTVKIDQLANTTTSVELKLSDIFDTILCAISSVRTTIPGDKNASVMTDGTTVTIYLHNNTNSVGTMWIYYVIFGALR